MTDAVDRKLLDKRVLQRYLRKGVLDEKELEKHMKSLPDLAEQAVPIESALEPSAAVIGGHAGSEDKQEE